MEGTTAMVKTYKIDPKTVMKPWSWGERSCAYYQEPCPYSPTFQTCNKSCPNYIEKVFKKDDQ